MNDQDERFERQVADVATRVVGPERHVDALAVVRQAMQPKPRRWSMSGLRGLSVAVASVGFVVLGGLAFLALLDQDESDVTGPAASPTSSASAIAEFRFDGATPIDDDKRRFAAISRLPSGEITVVGLNRRSGGGPRLPAAWTSHDDGATWNESALPFGTSAEAVDVVEHDGVFLAVGRTDNRADSKASTVWRSDDGLEWETLATMPDALITAIEVVPEGLAAIGLAYRDAIGFDEPAAFPTLWISADGKDWTAHTISDPWHEPGVEPVQQVGGISDLPMNVVRSEGGRWMVSGPDRDAIPGSERTSVWIGTPGEEWTRVSIPVSDTGATGRFDVIGWRPNGFILTGETIDENGSSYGIWLTPDGVTWENVHDAGAGAPLEVAASGTDLIAVIRPPVDWTFGGASYPVDSDIYRVVEDDHPLALRPDRLLAGAPVYVSTDGRTWSTHEPLDGFPLGATVDGRGSFLIVGADAADCDRWWCAYEAAQGAVPAIWIGTPETSE